MEYRFDGLPPGVYQIELKFAELANMQPNQRLFDVTIENQPVLVGYDIADSAGLFTADDHTWYMVVEDGSVAIRFVERRGFQHPVINALRVTHRPDR